MGAGLILLMGGWYLALSGWRDAAVPQGLSTVPVQVNYPAPELVLENLHGGVQSLADLRGQVVLVNNWATWCPPCKAELPALVSFYNDHAAEGFTLIGIEAGEPFEEVAGFVRQYGIPYPVWLDPENEALGAFDNPNLPNSYVIDRAGTVRLAWTGEISRLMLEKHVTPLIAAD